MADIEERKGAGGGVISISLSSTKEIPGPQLSSSTIGLWGRMAKHIIMALGAYTFSGVASRAVRNSQLGLEEEISRSEPLLGCQEWGTGRLFNGSRVSVWNDEVNGGESAGGHKFSSANSC